MNLTASNDLLLATRMSEKEMAMEVAVTLYQRDKLSLWQAAHLAGMGKIQFQHLLASRDIPLNLDVADLHTDIENLRALGRL